MFLAWGCAVVGTRKEQAPTVRPSHIQSIFRLERLGQLSKWLTVFVNHFRVTRVETPQRQKTRASSERRGLRKAPVYLLDKTRPGFHAPLKTTSLPLPMRSKFSEGFARAKTGLVCAAFAGLARFVANRAVKVGSETTLVLC